MSFNTIVMFVILVLYSFSVILCEFLIFHFLHFLLGLVTGHILFIWAQKVILLPAIPLFLLVFSCLCMVIDFLLLFVEHVLLTLLLVWEGILFLGLPEPILIHDGHTSDSLICNSKGFFLFKSFSVFLKDFSFTHIVSLSHLNGFLLLAHG